MTQCVIIGAYAVIKFFTVIVNCLFTNRFLHPNDRKMTLAGLPSSVCREMDW